MRESENRSLLTRIHNRVYELFDDSKARLPKAYRTLTFVDVRRSVLHHDIRVTHVTRGDLTSWISYAVEWTAPALKPKNLQRKEFHIVPGAYFTDAAERLEFVSQIVAKVVMRDYRNIRLCTDIPLALIATRACRRDPVDLKAGYRDLSALCICVETAPDVCRDCTCVEYHYQSV